MATKATKRPVWKNPHGMHPPEAGLVSSRGGCKVGWRTYASRAEAEKCREWALAEATHSESLGYDFGYCSPGRIDANPDGTFTVTIP